MATETSKDKEFVTSGYPPLHAMATLTLLLVVFSVCFPSMESIDEIATKEVFMNRIFPELVSVETLIYTRLGFGAFIVAISIQTIFSNGWTMKTAYLPSSKLRPGVIPFKGFRTQAPYTSFCWNMLGISFLLSGTVSYMINGGQEVPPALLRCTMLAWEIAAPNTLLVAAVVRYAIWPQILKKTGDTTNCRTWRALVWHNSNVAMALTEAALLGGLPVKFAHLSLSALYGIFYVFLTWSMMYQWIPGEGPHFVYFFFDITLGSKTSIVLLVLLGVLIMFYTVFAGAALILSYLGGGLLAHCIFMAIILSGVCRFRD